MSSHASHSTSITPDQGHRIHACFPMLHALLPSVKSGTTACMPPAIVPIFLCFTPPLIDGENCNGLPQKKASDHENRDHLPEKDTYCFSRNGSNGFGGLAFVIRCTVGMHRPFFGGLIHSGGEAIVRTGGGFLILLLNSGGYFLSKSANARHHSAVGCGASFSLANTLFCGQCVCHNYVCFVSVRCSLHHLFSLSSKLRLKCAFHLFQTCRCRVLWQKKEIGLRLSRNPDARNATPGLHATKSAKDG